MDPGPFLIDTNVFVIDRRYRRDRNYAVNRRFLDGVKRDRNGFTTTINLLELCGILSFNLEDQLQTVWDGFTALRRPASRPGRRCQCHRSRGRSWDCLRRCLLGMRCSC